MDWLHTHWQTIAAITVVAVTAGIFVRRLLRRDKTSCGGDCECPTRKIGSKSGP
jgi:hypothetical protein